MMGELESRNKETQQQMEEIDVVKGLIEKLVEGNAKTGQKQEIIWERYQCNGYYVNNCHAPTIDVNIMRDEVNKTLQKWIKEKYTKIVLEEMQNIVDDVLFTRLVALLESGSTIY